MSPTWRLLPCAELRLRARGLPPGRADIAAAAYAAGGEHVGRPLLRARLGILDCGRRRVPAGVGRLVVEALASLLWDGVVRLRVSAGAAGGQGRSRGRGDGYALFGD
jgi:hypothetical protein